MLDVNRENKKMEAEIEAAMAEVTRSGAFLFGPAVGKFEAAMAKYCGAQHAIGCALGSDALLLVLLALGVGPGDEVIVPSFTFFATASAVWRLGAKPVFADIVPETFNLDPADVVYKITSDTKAIIPVHLFGQCAAMGEIQQIADAARGIPIIEDACQAIGAEYKGKRAGSMGLASCFSYYPTKNLGGFGDGGLITTNDAELAAKLRVLCNHGMEPRYYHHFVGLNSRLDTLQAAVLNVKLPKLDEWVRRSRTTCTSLRDRIRPLGHRRFDRRAHGDQGLPACVESIHGAGKERPSRCRSRSIWPTKRLARRFTIRCRSICRSALDHWATCLAAYGRPSKPAAKCCRCPCIRNLQRRSRRCDRRCCGVLRRTQPSGSVVCWILDV